MSLTAIGALTPVPVTGRLDVLARPVRLALVGWSHIDSVGLVEIDPGLADTAALTQAYSVPLATSANCVIVMGRRGGEERIAACVVRADMRADVNNVARRLLDVRKASFLSMERAVEETGMEYGAITPVGIPSHWRLLIAAQVTEIPMALIGSGVRRSKLVLAGALLADLPHAEIVDDLGFR